MANRTGSIFLTNPDAAERAYAVLGNDQSAGPFYLPPMARAFVVELAARLNTTLADVANNIRLNEDGTFGWKGSFLIGMINSCGRFPLGLDWETEGTLADGTLKVRAHADLKDGQKRRAPFVALADVTSDDMTRNPMWTTDPMLMLYYRAASVFARIYCPEVLHGLGGDESEPAVVQAKTTAGVPAARAAETTPSPPVGPTAPRTRSKATPKPTPKPAPAPTEAPTTGEPKPETMTGAAVNAPESQRTPPSNPAAAPIPPPMKVEMSF